jgi:hypothetical protein
MSKPLKWIGQNLSLGGIVRNSGVVIGETLDISCEALSFGLSLIPLEEKKSSKSQEILIRTGKNLATTMQKVGTSCGGFVDKVTTSSAKVGEQLFEAAAKKSGLSDENTLVAKKLGSMTGALAVGAIAGGCLAEALIISSAVAGTTGAAATTSGLAGLAGGSIASGGGGMVVGQAIAQGITTVGAASGLATLACKEDETSAIPPHSK